MESAIGGLSGLLLAYVGMSKECLACSAIWRSGKISTKEMKAQHDCREHHFGKSSKSMEPTAAALLQHKLHKWFVARCPATAGRVLSAMMDPVVSDDDAASRAQLRPVDCSVDDTVASGPSWIGPINMLADPGHRNKCFTAPLYAVGVNAKVISYTKKPFAYLCSQAGTQ